MKSKAKFSYRKILQFYSKVWRGGRGERVEASLDICTAYKNQYSSPVQTEQNQVQHDSATNSRMKEARIYA